MDENYISNDISKKDIDRIEKIEGVIEKEERRHIRIEELETIAHNNMSGGDIANQLEDVNPELRKEYNKLMYDW